MQIVQWRHLVVVVGVGVVGVVVAWHSTQQAKIGAIKKKKKKTHITPIEVSWTRNKMMTKRLFRAWEQQA